MRLINGFAGKSLMFATACFVCLSTVAASAEYIQFTFTGEVTEIGGALWDPWLDTQLGDPVTVQYVFDSNAEDNSNNPLFGLYHLTDLIFAIGDTVQTSASGSVHVDNDVSYWGDDQYAVTFSFGGELIGAFSFSGFDMFSSDALPSDLEWTQYATSHVGMIGFASDNNHFIRYQFTNWTAEVVPGAPTLFVLLLGVSRKRRRH